MFLRLCSGCMGPALVFPRKQRGVFIRGGCIGVQPSSYLPRHLPALKTRSSKKKKEPSEAGPAYKDLLERCKEVGIVPLGPIYHPYAECACSFWCVSCLCMFRSHPTPFFAFPSAQAVEKDMPVRAMVAELPPEIDASSVKVCFAQFAIAISHGGRVGLAKSRPRTVVKRFSHLCRLRCASRRATSRKLQTQCLSLRVYWSGAISPTHDGKRVSHEGGLLSCPARREWV